VAILPVTLFRVTFLLNIPWLAERTGDPQACVATVFVIFLNEGVGSIQNQDVAPVDIHFAIFVLVVVHEGVPHKTR
jgi:hypothetical protein